MKAFVTAKLVFPDRVEEGVILEEKGKILASGNVIPPEAAEIIDLGGAYVGPGLIDIHCHGFSGAGSKETYYVTADPENMAKAHLKGGTTSITPSIPYCEPVDSFFSGIEKIKAAMAKEDSTILGIHFEGPFINPKYGANSQNAWAFSRETCDKIFDAAGDAVLHCTYAPEMPFGEEMEQILAERGVIADIGHTEVDPVTAARAVKNGARIVTHLFDAMGCWRGRESVAETGVLQESADAVVLAIPGLYYELICDSRGIHVKPANAKMAFRIAGEDGIILVTDNAGEQNYDPADYPADHPRSTPDLNYNDAGQLSGSCIILSGACKSFMNFTGADVRTAFKCASTNPARALRMDDKIGSILPGRDANLLVVDEDFAVKAVYFRGEEVI